MKSLYQRQFIIMAGVILVSFALLGSAFITLSYSYTVQEQQDSILHNAVYVADVLGDAVTSDTDLQGFVLKAARVRPTLEAVAVVTDATVLLATQEGQILFAVDGTGEISSLANVQIPTAVVQAIQATGSFSAMSSLGGTFSENRYVAGAPFRYNHLGNAVPAGLVLIAAEAASLTEMWRAFASIFLFTAVVVMLIAFEVVQEAGLRLPAAIGQTVSILGGLVVGSAAVEAKLVSPAVLVMVAIAGIAGYTAPSQDFSGALRLWRFGITLAAGVAGLIGLVLAGMALVYHLASLESFGVAYLTPFASCGGSGERGHVVFRQPLPWVKTRPRYLNPQNRRNQG